MRESGEEPYTRLVPDLRGVDPDDAFSAIPYEKGFALIYHLEQQLGGPGASTSFLKNFYKMAPSLMKSLIFALCKLYMCLQIKISLVVQ